MPTPKKGKRLGANPAHQKAMLASLATSLFEHGAIRTTEAKARTLRPYAEKLITKAKKGDLHNRRQVMRVIRDKDIVHELFTEIGPRYADRPGGYTRITKIGPRYGDNAPMAVIELVEAEFTPKVRSTKSDEKPAATPAEEPKAEETKVEADTTTEGDESAEMVAEGDTEERTDGDETAEADESGADEESDKDA